jgi:hypothetical protein
MEQLSAIRRWWLKKRVSSPAVKLDWVRNEITRMREHIRAQEREIRMLQRAGISTASAELLLARMRAKVEDLRREREALRKAVQSQLPNLPSARS